MYMSSIERGAERAAPRFTERTVLTSDECRRVRDDVYALRKFWSCKSAENLSCTLGAATYVEATIYDPVIYRGKAKIYNSILRTRLGWLYARLADVLAEMLGEPAAYRDDLALPGFHIFLGKTSLESLGEGAHFDGQFRLLDWGPEADLEHTLSFTLPVALPRSGGGLDYWDLYADEVSTPGSYESVAPHLRVRPKLYYPYSLGAIVVHSGRFYHVIAKTVAPHDDDERISLQGHAVRCGDRWLLYW
jgi:hypothetical protein